MAQFHGRNAALWIWDNGATCRNISGDLNNVQLTWTRDNAESTTMGKDSKQRISGLRDATLTGAAVYNSGGNAIDVTMSALMAGSVVSLISFAPGGSLTGCPVYNACMLISNWSITAPLNGVVAAAFTFQLASGSVSASTSG